MAGLIEQLQPFFSEKEKCQQEKPVIWHGFKVVICYFFYETPSMVIGVAIGGIVMHPFIPQLAMACYFFAIASLVIRHLVKLSPIFHSKLEHLIKEKAWEIKKKYPYLQTAMVILSLAVACLLPTLSISLAIVSGGFSGIVLEVEHCKKHQVSDSERMERAHREWNGFFS